MPPTDTAQGGDELISAIQRLPHAVLTCDPRRGLQAVNHSGLKLMEREELTHDLLSQDPDHPLSRMIAMTVDGSHVGSQILELSSGGRYEVDVSVRSQKGSGRWILLICRDLSEKYLQEQEAKYSRWQFTAREREVARKICAGVPSDVICREIGIAPNTLKTHISNILGKSNSPNRSVFIARMRETLPPPRDSDDSKE